MSDVSGSPVTPVAETTAPVATVAAVAETAPVTVPKEPRSALVRRSITQVEEALRTQTPAQVMTQFADFQKQFPQIFQLVLTRTYPRDIMAILLDNLDRMERGTRSQHDASVAVGTVLVDRIVKPQLASSKK